jgi:ABC-2 type transport system permease protein
MTVIANSVPAGRLGFRHVARMEWIKLRTLHSTWWTLAVTAAGATSLAVIIGLNTRDAAGDLTNNALAGMVPGLLGAGVLGVLVVTGEFSSGMIRATFAAAPRRPLLLAAKAAVFGAVALAVGEAAALTAFFAGGAALRHGIPAPSLGQPGVLQAVLLTGTSFCLIGLIGLGLGAIIRHTGAAIAVLVGGVYLAPQLVAAVARPAVPYMPMLIIGNSLSTTKPWACPAGATLCPHFLPPWAGLAVLCLYAAVALGAGGWLLIRRDV